LHSSKDCGFCPLEIHFVVTAPKFFRFLIVARIVLAVIFRLTGLVRWDHERFTAQDPLGPFLGLLIELPIAAAIVVIIVGLWQFRWWARIGYVAISLAYAIVAIFFPSHASFEHSPAVAAFAYFEVLSQGALIAMAFLPPVSKRFEMSKDIMTSDR
jgi:hypothetical protein